MIKPLRDIIVAVMLDDTDKSGLLVMPKNYSQKLLQHGKAVVLAAGPIAQEQGIEAGTVIHCSEAWGEAMEVGLKKYRIGRSRDIDGVCVGERIKDTGKYLD